MSSATSPTAFDLAREACYICRPDGFTAIRCNSAPTDAELELLGLVRVESRPVLCRPPVCPVNGAEGGDESYYLRLPHRPDGTRLTYG